jgi:thiol:disulfide interchange protein
MSPVRLAALLLWALLPAALAGGLILNLMPCVFPILAMKALSLAGQGGAGRRERACTPWPMQAGS